MPDVVLALPPQWTPQNPPFALASLGGHLRSRGLSTRLVDLNLDYYLEVLTPAHMQFVRHVTLMRRDLLARKCQLRMMMGIEGESLAHDASHLLRIEAVLERSASGRGDAWSEVARQLPSALDVMRDAEAFYQPEALLAALSTIDLALELAALPYHPCQLALNNFYSQDHAYTVAYLESATRDAWGNPFLAFMKGSAARLLVEGARVVALSINSFSQVVPGLTLARLIKEGRPAGVHVTIGGNFFGRVAHRLESLPRFFELFCDSVVVGEGEDALERLTRAVLEGNPLDEVPETLWLDGHGTVRRTPPPSSRLPLAEVGFLDLSDLRLEQYLTPAPVLCIQASRGCYYGKCTFCDAYWGMKLDKKPVHRVVAEMAYLRERYGIRHFEFIDECLPPGEMKELASAVGNADLDIRWFANARLEPGFVDSARGIASGGATMLLWGFETGSGRILKRTAKGVDIAGRWDVLEASAAAGLWNFAYIFFGFPGETAEDAHETIEAICNNTRLIHSYGRSIFSMGLHSPLARRPDAFGVSEVREEGEELSVNVAFRSLDGPTPDEVTMRAEECTRRCREAYGSPLWMGLRNRENLHLYIARYGARAVSEWSIGCGGDSAVTAFQK